VEGEGGPGLNFPLIESYGTLIYAYKLCRSNSQRPPWAPLVAAKAMNDRRQTASSAGLNQGAAFNLRLPLGATVSPIK